MLSLGPRGTSVEEKGAFLAQLPVSLPPKARCPSSIEAMAETSPVPWGLPSYGRSFSPKRWLSFTGATHPTLEGSEVEAGAKQANPAKQHF